MSQLAAICKHDQRRQDGQTDRQTAVMKAWVDTVSRILPQGKRKLPPRWTTTVQRAQGAPCTHEGKLRPEARRWYNREAQGQQKTYRR